MNELVAPEAGAGDVDGDVEGDAAVGEHQHPVGEEHGLVDVVGDEQHGRCVAGAEPLERACASGSG